ncbi:hypothetical protein EPN42_05660 [bacterium]|nr:MAG: hypothetical protein EPN42_05660 [bacterium]
MSRRNRERVAESAAPRRYSEMFADGATAPSASSPSSPLAGHVENAAPASVIGGARTMESFARAGDEPDDLDRARRHHLRIDSISQALGSVMCLSDQRFEWCRGVDGYRMAFSRRYPELDLIVDLFVQDSPAVRKEVARKRELIAAHNAQAADAFTAADEDAKRFMRARGLAPMGYLPIFQGRFGRYDVDWDGAKQGKVLDLPPSTVHPQWDPAGVGVQAIGAR